MTDLSTLRFFTTQAHPCSYLEGQQATTLFLDPAVQPDLSLHSRLSRQGFRRSGDYLYRPHCAACHACLPARVMVSEFQPNRRFRRILSHNQDLQVRLETPSAAADYYDLYQRYISLRHRDGDMYPPSRQQFEQFLLSHWGSTRFLCFREREKLLAVAVTDQLDDGLSAVYCFFEPEASRRSLGVHALLTQLEECRRLGLPYLYLGYLIRNCRKMAYKEDFGPLEVFSDKGWQALPPSR